MSKFDWQTAQSLRDRYQASVHAVGLSAWQDLIDQLVGTDSPSSLFDEFMRKVQAFPPASGQSCLFISHRRADVQLALAIAKIATSEGYDYWLDVHDPVLQVASLSTGAARGIIIAAIIEMALLNSTHVIATHTVDSAGSTWIPYELGRAKQRTPVSSQAAGWFAPGYMPSNCGDYTYLMVETYSEQDIHDWLQLATTGPTRPAVPGSLHWKLPIPPRLPQRDAATP